MIKAASGSKNHNRNKERIKIMLLSLKDCLLFYLARIGCDDAYTPIELRSDAPLLPNLPVDAQ